MRRRLQWFTSSCPLRQRQHGALFLPVRTPIPPAPRQDSQDRTTHHRSRYIAASRPDYTCLTLETYITYRLSTQNAYARNTHLNHFTCLTMNVSVALACTILARLQRAELGLLEAYLGWLYMRMFWINESLVGYGELGEELDPIAGREVGSMNGRNSVRGLDASHEACFGLLFSIEGGADECNS